MERCALCKVEDTDLYESGVAICLKCAALREAKAKEGKLAGVQQALVRNLTEATLLAESAAKEFNAVTSDIPSFIPAPDGTERIHNASRKMKEARDALMEAHRRLNDYLERGIVPGNLKRSSSSQ